MPWLARINMGTARGTMLHEKMIEWAEDNAGCDWAYHGLNDVIVFFVETDYLAFKLRFGQWLC